jgi:Cep192 domain 4/Abnormal spindle-like microcephaly-assoc'd, ASPM-SPD-2-Hydin
LLESCLSAVFPETNSNYPDRRQRNCQYFAYICLLLMAAIFSPGAAQGQGLLLKGALSFSPSPGGFGAVNVGSSKTITLTVTNTGRAPVTISTESVHATGFSVSGLTVPYNLSAGASITLSVKFAPTGTGLSSGYVLFTSNASNGSAQYSVSGTGVTASAAGTVATTPSSVSFGTVATGTTNSQSVQLKNTGGSSMTISSATAIGTGFKLSGISLPLTLSAGQTSNFTVGFTPAASGSVTGSVTIKSNASNQTYTVALSGTGASATRTISLGTTSLNFGNEAVGGMSTLQVALKNTGNSSVTISNINVAAAGFGITSGIIGSTIAAGQTAELNVVFAPKVTGSVSGALSLVSNATNSPNSLAVAGTGVSSTAHSVALNWAASSSSGVTGYYVYRSTLSGSSYTRITSSVVNALKYTDATVSSGETYYYVVTAVNSSGAESGQSAEVHAVIP